MIHPRALCDKIRWIDTSSMAAGCLAKNMPTNVLVEVLHTSAYDATPDPESTSKKVKKQLARVRMNATPSGK
eukprot:4572952-Pyramimonas_sp.AAC.1